MKTLKFQDKEAWFAARRGKITGTRLKDIVSKRDIGKRKIGFYELIAERISTAPDGENPMDRGVRLECDAVDRFVKETGKKVDTSLVIWTRDEDESIAVSPDGFIGKTEAVEAKCLASARHIEAWLTKKVPDEYEFQALQYFIVNDKLKTLHFAFFDPRIPAKDYFTITVNRKDVEKDIEEYLAYEKQIISEVNEIVNSLTF